MATIFPKTPRPFLLLLRRTVPSSPFSSSTATIPDFPPPPPPPPTRLATKSALRSETDPDQLARLLLSSDLPLDSAPFHRVVARLARARRPDLVHLLLSPSLHPPDPHRLTRLIALYSSAAMPDHAAAAFALIPDPPERALCALMAAFLDNRLPAKARECFHRPDLAAIPRGLPSCNLLLRALCGEGDVRTAEDLVMGGMVDQMGVDPDAASFAVVLRARLRNWDVPNFEKVERELVQRGLAMEISTYNCRIAFRCRKGGDLGSAEEVFDEMLQRGVRPNLETYNTLIGGYCRMGDLAGARKWFRRLRDGGDCGSVRLDGVSYSLLVRLMVAKGELGEAVDVCRESLGKGWAPPSEVVRSLVEGLVGDMERVEEARVVVGMMRGCVKGQALVNWIKFESTLPL